MDIIIDPTKEYVFRICKDAADVRVSDIKEFVNKFKDIEGVSVGGQAGEYGTSTYFYTIVLRVPCFKDYSTQRRVATKQEQEFIKNQLELVRKIIPDFIAPESYRFSTAKTFKIGS